MKNIQNIRERQAKLMEIKGKKEGKSTRHMAGSKTKDMRKKKFMKIKRKVGR